MGDYYLTLNSQKYSTFPVDAMKEGSTVILRNAKIDMYKGSMRLAVDRWGRVESTELADSIRATTLAFVVTEPFFRKFT